MFNFTKVFHGRKISRDGKFRERSISSSNFSLLPYLLKWTYKLIFYRFQTLVDALCGSGAKISLEDVEKVSRDRQIVFISRRFGRTMAEQSLKRRRRERERERKKRFFVEESRASVISRDHGQIQSAEKLTRACHNRLSSISSRYLSIARDPSLPFRDEREIFKFRRAKLRFAPEQCSRARRREIAWRENLLNRVADLHSFNQPLATHSLS